MKIEQGFVKERNKVGVLQQYQNVRDANDARLQRAMELSDMERYTQFMALMRLGRLLKYSPKRHKALDS